MIGGIALACQSNGRRTPCRAPPAPPIGPFRRGPCRGTTFASGLQGRPLASASPAFLAIVIHRQGRGEGFDRAIGWRGVTRESYRRAVRWRPLDLDVLACGTPRTARPGMCPRPGRAAHALLLSTFSDEPEKSPRALQEHRARLQFPTFAFCDRPRSTLSRNAESTARVAVFAAFAASDCEASCRSFTGHASC
jgi:hypothetical protein